MIYVCPALYTDFLEPDGVTTLLRHKLEAMYATMRTDYNGQRAFSGEPGSTKTRPKGIAGSRVYFQDETSNMTLRAS